MIAAKIIGIKQHRIIAQILQLAPPFGRAIQVASCMIFSAGFGRIMHININAEPFARGVFAFCVEANQLGFAVMAAGKMPGQFIDGDHVAAAHFLFRQGHGLIGFAFPAALGWGQN